MVIFVFPNDAAQIAITVLLAFHFFAVLEVLSPYKSEFDMWLLRGGHETVFLSMSTCCTQGKCGRRESQSQAVLAGVFVAGDMLMILAIVVEVVGVCYAPGKRKLSKKRRHSKVLQ